MRIGYVFTLWRYPYINSKTSPGALFLWEAWEVISGAKVLLFFHICKCFVCFFAALAHLRAQDLLMYCSQDFYDKYSESYQKTHGGLSYNSQYLQNTVEGSQGRLKLVPLANKADSKFIHISTKKNMLYGYDNMSDVESIEVERFAPFVLTYVATMFFGVQFESIDKSCLKVVELAAV